MIYLIQVTLYTAILYVVYLLFLKNKAHHNWSRAYLLMNMVLPIMLPLIRIPSFSKITDVGAEVMLPVVTIGQQVAEEANSISMIPVIYAAIACTLLGYFIAQIVQVQLFIKSQQKEKAGNIYLLRNTAMGPGSWFNYVFMPGNEINEVILKHETAHVGLKHSCDIIFLSLMRCIFWPNVMLWIIGKELKTVHEFQADAYASTDAESYGSKLLAEVFHSKHFQVSHTFFHNPIKRRIMMLQNKTRAGKLKVITLSSLLVGGMLFAQCAKDNTKQLAANHDQEMTIKAVMDTEDGPKEVTFQRNTDTPKQDENGVYNFVDKMPEFEGDLMTYLGSNIKYPKEALSNKIEGRVTTKFVVDEQGRVVDVRVIKSPNELLSKAALDVISKMPNWKPGSQGGKNVKVYFTLPILFKLPSPAPATIPAK